MIKLSRNNKTLKSENKTQQIGEYANNFPKKQRYISPKVCYTIIEDSTRVNDLLERKNIAEVQR